VKESAREPKGKGCVGGSEKEEGESDLLLHLKDWQLRAPSEGKRSRVSTSESTQGKTLPQEDCFCGKKYSKSTRVEKEIH